MCLDIDIPSCVDSSPICFAIVSSGYAVILVRWSLGCFSCLFVAIEVNP